MRVRCSEGMTAGVGDRRARASSVAIGWCVVLGLVAALLGCSDGKLYPTQPDPTPTPTPPPPNLTGEWRGTLTERVGDRRTFTIALKLRQPPGSANVRGTIETVYRDGHFRETIVSGTQEGLDLTLETVMYDSLGKAVYYHYEARVDEGGQEMDGQSRVSG
jgi:hypothetical protein